MLPLFLLLLFLHKPSIQNFFMYYSWLPLDRGLTQGCRAEIRTRACLAASRRATVLAKPHYKFTGVCVLKTKFKLLITYRTGIDMYINWHIPVVLASRVKKAGIPIRWIRFPRPRPTSSYRSRSGYKSFRNLPSR
jgi:hypothetical protein